MTNVPQPFILSCFLIPILLLECSQLVLYTDNNIKHNREYLRYTRKTFLQWKGKVQCLLRHIFIIYIYKRRVVDDKQTRTAEKGGWL